MAISHADTGPFNARARFRRRTASTVCNMAAAFHLSVPSGAHNSSIANTVVMTVASDFSLLDLPVARSLLCRIDKRPATCIWPRGNSARGALGQHICTHRQDACGAPAQRARMNGESARSRRAKSAARLHAVRRHCWLRAWLYLRVSSSLSLARLREGGTGSRTPLSHSRVKALEWGPKSMQRGERSFESTAMQAIEPVCKSGTDETRAGRARSARWLGQRGGCQTTALAC